MSLVTRCPVCATAFRVQRGQLAARGGKVRCGKCSQIFDGIASLVEEGAEPLKGGAPAYALLRSVLAKTNKTGIAKVVIRSRQHLAALKANDRLLVLELMHFADELVPADGIKVPEERKLGKREEEMAETLVEQMTEKWDPKRYTDDYTSSLMKLIERKVESGGKSLPTEKGSRRAATNVIVRPRCTWRVRSMRPAMRREITAPVMMPVITGRNSCAYEVSLMPQCFSMIAGADPMKQAIEQKLMAAASASMRNSG